MESSEGIQWLVSRDTMIVTTVALYLTGLGTWQALMSTEVLVITVFTIPSTLWRWWPSHYRCHPLVIWYAIRLTAEGGRGEVIEGERGGGSGGGSPARDESMP